MKNKTLLFSILLIFIPLCKFSQSFNGPESVEYNSNTGSYFISNSNNGQILELDNNNELSVFITNVGTGPHGLEIVNNILYACSGGRLKGYDLNNGNQVLNYNFGASFLNGITHMENTLFITDFSDRKLYTYSIEEESHDEIASFTKNPNGTYWDSISNRLLVIFWGNNAPIFEIDYINGEYNTIIMTGLGNLDGIAMDQCGNFYISAWSSNAIHKYNSSFSETEIVVENLSNPADICYNQFDNIIGIPNSGNNSVDFIFSPCDNSSIKESEKIKNLLKKINILGIDANQKGFNIEIYDDGSVEKKYILD